MSSKWPIAKMGEVLQRWQDWIHLQPEEQYREVTVRLWGKGVVLRRVALGSEIAASTRLRVRTGQFILSRIDARNGAIGIIPAELDGAIVSNDFPAFDAEATRVVPEFLGWMSKTDWFVEACRQASEGTTNRVRLKEEAFLGIGIPLPPLDEQRRIVARLNAVWSRTGEALAAAREAADQCATLFDAVRAQRFEQLLGRGSVPLNSVAKLERGKFSYRPRNDPRFFGGKYPWIQIGEIEAADKWVRSWTHTLNDDGLSVSRKFPRGTLLVSIAATIGACAILDFDCCVPDSVVAASPIGDVDASFLYHYFGHVRTHLEEVAPQSAQKNINLKILSSLRFPVVSLREQMETSSLLDELRTKLDAARERHGAVCAEMQAAERSITARAFRSGC